MSCAFVSLDAYGKCVCVRACVRARARARVEVITYQQDEGRRVQASWHHPRPGGAQADWEQSCALSALAALLPHAWPLRR